MVQLRAEHATALKLALKETQDKLAKRDARVSTRRPRGEVEAQAGAGGGGGQFDGATTSRVDYVPHMIGVQNVGPVRVLFRK